MDLTNTVYVFTSALGQGEDVLVGKLTVNDVSGFGEFLYAKGWLDRGDAFAIDPINLPLNDSVFKTTMNNGVFSVLLDSGPDSWGKHLMNRILERPPRSNVELLLASSGGAGALTYSATRSGAINHADSVYIDPESLAEYVLKLESHSSNIPDFIKVVLFAGSSIGGARPKFLIRQSNGDEFIAKLNKANDIFNVARVERSMLQFSALNGVRTPSTELCQLQGRDTLLVKRFDRHNGHKLHYVSAHSLLNGHKVKESDTSKHISYSGIAELLRKMSTSPTEDCLELFKRAAINILVGNTDDHLKNHGFLFFPENNGYRLSEVFDIVPQPNQTTLQAIGAGNGRASSLDDLISISSAFLLSATNAARIIDDIINNTGELSSILSSNGVSVQDQAMVMKIIEEKSTTFSKGKALIESHNIKDLPIQLNTPSL